MANIPINSPKDFDITIKEYLTSEDNHADTFNQRLERLVNNQAYLKQLDTIESTVNPTESDDNYKIGNLWVNTAENKFFLLIDNTTNNALWIEITTETTLENVFNDFEATGDLNLNGNKLLNVGDIDYTSMGYGIEWIQGTDTINRIGKTNIDFDNIFPYKGMKRCNLADNGTVNAYYGDPLYKDDGSNGQVMVEIPKFYYKSVKIGNKYSWMISDKNLDGFKVHPAFVKNGVELDYFYFAAYEGHYNNGVLESKSGVKPSTDSNVPTGTRSNFRSWAKARGNDWGIRDYNTTSAIQLLYLIEFATFDSQSAIGRGVCDKASGSGNESINTGATSHLGNKTGMANGTDGLTSISYRGIENFYGNIREWVDGININNYEVFIADHNYQDDKFDGHYSSIGSVLSTNDTYIKDIIYEDTDYSFLASEGGGNSSSYLTDNWWINNGKRTAAFGGHWNHGSQDGAFCWYLDDSASVASQIRGSRLLYRK